MHTELVAGLLKFYNHWLDEVANVRPVRIDDDPANYAHLMWLTDHAEFHLLEEGQIHEAVRVLGFVQGALAACGDFTWADFDAHRQRVEARLRLEWEVKKT